ncbi:MAG: CPBP family intramembrane metalloprotease [Oscillospiraceae bacterium]|nr:CPBP family intramembrane metalloprotease [Oscillospiraceae bacterium]
MIDRFNDYINEPAMHRFESLQEQEIKAEQKKNETQDFKKFLKILALTVVFITIAEKFMSHAVWSVFFGLDFTFAFSHLHVPNFDYFIETISGDGARVLTQDSLYFIQWALNDIIVYLPSLIVMPFAFRKYMNRSGLADGQANRYNFPAFGVLTLFLSAYSLSYAGGKVTAFIADFLDGLFGTGELENVFADVMPTSGNQWLLMYLFVGLIGPIAEEVIFRHMLLRPLRRFGDMQAVIITSLLFGAFHGNLYQLLYTSLAGFVMGVAAVKANSVMPAIFIHVLNNTFDIAKSHFFEMSIYGEIPVSPYIVSNLYMMVVYGGLLLSIVLMVNHHFSLTNDNPHLSTGERARMAFANPWILAMMAVLIYTIV